MLALQHPDAANCKKHKQVLGSWCLYGVGACFHLMSRPMTRAWNLSRSYNFNYGTNLNYPTAKSSFCGAPGKSELECFLKPQASCRDFAFREEPLEFLHWGTQEKVRKMSCLER